MSLIYVFYSINEWGGGRTERIYFRKQTMIESDAAAKEALKLLLTKLLEAKITFECVIFIIC